jgi:hypothetical protein
MLSILVTSPDFFPRFRGPDQDVRDIRSSGDYPNIIAVKSVLARIRVGMIEDLAAGSQRLNRPSPGTGTQNWQEYEIIQYETASLVYLGRAIEST